MCLLNIPSARSAVSNLIRSRILLSGPIPVADYMRLALTAQPIAPKKNEKNALPKSGGYYMKNDVFGQKGDFITSPEISQLFGEMLAVWGLQTWVQIGGPKKFSIVEFGPGRGTLSKDILRVFKRFEHITGSKVSLHLVEISPFLATVQHASLTASKEMKTEEKARESEDAEVELLDPFREGESSYYHNAIAAETESPVYWYRDIKDLPKDFHFYVAHEFFDALPVHKLQKVNNEWREVLIDINPASKEDEFRFVISRHETPVIKLLQEKYGPILKDKREQMEVSLDTLCILENLTHRLNTFGGIASIIDYGHEGTKQDTFRAFYKHKLHNPLEQPGTADLTADVDFSIIQKIFEERSWIFGPTKQRNFLSEVGIEHRLNDLLKKVSPEERESLISGYKMIVEEMGDRFNVMTILPNVLKSCMTDLKLAGFSRQVLPN